jgi:hypothetical protein
MLYVLIENKLISEVYCAVDDSSIKNTHSNAITQPVENIFDESAGESINSFLIRSQELAWQMLVGTSSVKINNPQTESSLNFIHL